MKTLQLYWRKHCEQILSKINILELTNRQVIDVIVTLPTRVIAIVEAQMGLEVSGYLINFAYKPQ